MLFTVTDKHGRFVTDLKRDDFEVFENKKPQNILEFTSETDLPLRLAILVDTSNSIRDRFRFQQEAAINFINGVMRRQDKAIVVSFDSSTELVADLTGDTNKLENAIRDLRPGGGTSLYDAIYFACHDKLMQDQPLYTIPARHGHFERRRRQRQPLQPRPGAGNGAESRRGRLHDFDQHHPPADRRRQSDALFRPGNRRRGVLPFPGQRSESVV